MTRGALYMQAIRGPLVLITLGALFAMHQADFLSLERTWPLIIIVIGLVKLVERLLVQPGFPASGGFPAGTYPTGTYAPGTYQQSGYGQQPPPAQPGGPKV